MTACSESDANKNDDDHEDPVDEGNIDPADDFWLCREDTKRRKAIEWIAWWIY